jgi:hypothetical protein
MLGAISVMLSTSYIVKGTLLFMSLHIEVGYCREVELDSSYSPLMPPSVRLQYMVSIVS